MNEIMMNYGVPITFIAMLATALYKLWKWRRDYKKEHEGESEIWYQFD